MVTGSYIPDEGDVVWIDFFPQSGHEQTGRRQGLVVTPRNYNKIGLAVILPITNQKKGYPFEVTIPSIGVKTTGVVLADQLRNLDWQQRNATFIEKLPKSVVSEVKEKLALLLGMEMISE